MSYDLDQFCQDSRAALAAEPGRDGRDKVRRNLERLLTDPDFLAAELGPDQAVGRRTLYEDPDMGFVVLAYVTDEGHKSPPHDHGTSWAIYGQATDYTDMTEFDRLDGGAGAGAAKLEQIKHYRLDPGMAGLYDGAEIHAIDYPAGARFVRVTGADLDHVPRLRYDMDAGQAVVIESATASD